MSAPPSFLTVVRAYIGFGQAEARDLADLREQAEPHFERIADSFYDNIAADPAAAAVMGGDAQVQRLKRSLVSWLGSGLSGPHDEAYYRRRTRIGRKHVQVDLPQRYMLTAMNGIRADLHELVEQAYAHDSDQRCSTARAIDKWVDMELAIMLETYKEGSESQLRRTERLASMGQLAGTIGHELRNPLSVIESSLFLLRSVVPDGPRATRHLDKIQAQVRLAGDTITDLLEMTRGRMADRAPTRLADTVEAAAQSVDWPEDVELVCDVPGELELEAEGALLQRAVSNLLTNAIAALEAKGSGRVWIQGTRVDERVILRVADDGPGFAEEILPNAFEPLVTGRKKGVGLGLALVRNVCERHAARVSASNREEGGGVVEMVFPARRS